MLRKPLQNSDSEEENKQHLCQLIKDMMRINIALASRLSAVKNRDVYDILPIALK